MITMIRLLKKLSIFIDQRSIIKINSRGRWWTKIYSSSRYATCWQHFTLGGIINQNPNLQVSPLSPLARVVSALHLSFEGESWENFDWTSEQEPLARKTARAWYSDYKTKVLLTEELGIQKLARRLLMKPGNHITKRYI